MWHCPSLNSLPPLAFLSSRIKPGSLGGWACVLLRKKCHIVFLAASYLYTCSLGRNRYNVTWGFCLVSLSFCLEKVVEHLPSMQKVLGWILNTSKRQEKNGREGNTEMFVPSIALVQHEGTACSEASSGPSATFLREEGRKGLPSIALYGGGCEPEESPSIQVTTATPGPKGPRRLWCLRPSLNDPKHSLHCSFQ